MNENLMITPHTKVAELLEAYPDLMEKLIEIVPAFEKLKNPVLRKTIARITSLQQAAAIGKVSLDELINQLRAVVGQDNMEFTGQDAASGGQPDWFDESKIVKILDARPLIASGNHPLEQVLRETNEMKEGDIYELLTPFLPAPLIDKVKDRGFDSWSDEKQGVYHNYFCASK